MIIINTEHYLGNVLTSFSHHSSFWKQMTKQAQKGEAYENYNETIQLTQILF